jgi:hypothetical protein
MMTYVLKFFYTDVQKEQFKISVKHSIVGDETSGS